METVQKYLETLVEDSKKRVKKYAEVRKSDSYLFSEIEDFSLLDDDKHLDKLYNVSIMHNDVIKSFQKIASFLYFMNAIGMDNIDTSVIQEAQGLPEFISTHSPFEMFSYIDEDDNFKLKDLDPSLYEEFVRNIKRQLYTTLH